MTSLSQAALNKLLPKPSGNKKLQDKYVNTNESDSKDPKVLAIQAREGKGKQPAPKKSQNVPAPKAAPKKKNTGGYVKGKSTATAAELKYARNARAYDRVAHEQTGTSKTQAEMDYIRAANKWDQAAKLDKFSKAKAEKVRVQGKQKQTDAELDFANKAKAYKVEMQKQGKWKQPTREEQEYQANALRWEAGVSKK